jgi:hypothetical protein
MKTFSEKCCLHLVQTDSRTVFIASEKDCLLMDMLSTMYVEISEIEESKYKVMSPEWRLCEQVFALEFTYLH